MAATGYVIFVFEQQKEAQLFYLYERLELRAAHGTHDRFDFDE